MSSTFDITPLRSLVAVAITGGVHRAADSLLLTQSAVSQHLKKLETAAGTPIVTRQGRGIALTPDGEELLAHARAILRAHDAAVDRFDRQSSSVYRIGIAQNSAGAILSKVMPAMSRHMPGAQVRLHLDRHHHVREMLARDQLDVVLTIRVAPELPSHSDGLRLGWFVTPDWDVTADVSMPLVVFSPPCTLRQPSFDSWSTIGRRWHIAAEVNDLATALDAARSGIGAMLVPMLERFPDELRPLAHAPEVPAIQLAVVYSDRTPPELPESVAAALGEFIGVDRVHTALSSTMPMS